MGRMLIRDIILGLKQKGVTILLCSHILADVEQVCDRVALLKDGKVQQIASIDELVGPGVQSVEVVLEGLSAPAIAEIGFGEPIARSNERVTFELETPDRANALVRAALEQGAHVVSLIPRRESLEQLFVDEMTVIDRVEREKP